MSHYTVLVIGEDYEGQLAPYNEALQVAPYRKYADSADLKWYREVYAKEHEGAEPENLEVLASWLSKHWDGDYRYEPQGGIYQLSTYNPNSKWDWYQVGGRWAGFFKVKEGVPVGMSQKGGPGVMGTERGLDADSIRKGDVDVEWMRDDAARHAEERWDRANKSFGDTPEAKPWEDYHYRVKEEEITVEEARLLYHAQPRVKAFIDAKLNIWESVEDLQIPREEYVQRARDRAIQTYAYVKDGEWFAPGTMGWFGMSDETKLAADRFVKEFNEMFDALPDDTLLTVVDCHI